MEVSDQKLELNGQDLLQTVTSLTGLPEELIRGELDQIVAVAGQDSQNLTLDQLRAVLVSYLESMEADLMAEDQTGLPESFENEL